MGIETDIAWLAAVIEAEGSISAQVTSRKKDGHLVVTPMIRIVNNDVSINTEIIRICKALNVAVSFRERNDSTVQVRIDGMHSVDLLLSHIQPYLKSSKVKNANVIREFIKLRKGKNRDVFNTNFYSRKELSMICSIRNHPRALCYEEMTKFPNIER